MTCFNCGEQDNLKRIVCKVFLETRKEVTSLLEYAGLVKASTGLMNADQPGTGQVQAPLSYLVQSFPVGIGEIHPQSNQKT